MRDSGPSIPSLLATKLLHSPLYRRLEWKPCPDIAGYHCSKALMPMDHDHPVDGRTVTLSLIKLPCISANKTGTILFNFGGPGMYNDDGGRWIDGPRAARPGRQP